VGPADADIADIEAAVAALDDLVRAGGDLAAGADADLGHGFRSGRLDGGPGDRRDALLAALRAGNASLGPLPTVLAGLFGPAVTRRVGVAARDALAEQQWDTLKYAAAVSDVLGPEQLEQILTLRAPSALAVFGEGLASVTSVHLSRILAPVVRPRRLRLLIDLWERVRANREAADHLDRTRDSQRVTAEVRDRIDSSTMI
jgi:hypothetical protein